MRLVAKLCGIALVLVLSGCASSKMGGPLKRLESQVLLLEDRVGQLERTDVEWGFTRAIDASSLESEEVVKFNEPKPMALQSSGKPTTHKIQQALHNAGFYQGNIDGKMGPLTRGAIREFQRVHGLKDDAIVGTQTWIQLRSFTDLIPDGEELLAPVLK